MTDAPDRRRRVDRVPDDLDLSDIHHRYPTMREKIEALPEDEWDGLCDLDFEMGPSTRDEDIPGLVLFAGIDYTDPEAVEHHRQEWIALFGGGE